MKAKKHIIWMAVLFTFIGATILLAKPIQHLYTEVSTQKSADAVEAPYFVFENNTFDLSEHSASSWSDYDGVTVYDPAKKTNAGKDIEINISSMTGALTNPVQCGTYVIKYYATSPYSGLEATGERTVHIIDSRVSTAKLTVPETIEVEQGKSFKDVAMKNISAVDGDGTSLLAKVSYDSVDTSTVHDQKVVYRVTGKNGTEVTATTTVKVVEAKNYEDAIIYAEDVTIEAYEGQYNYEEFAKAIDDGGNGEDITNKLTHVGRVVTNNTGTGISKYTLTYSVKGANGNTVTKKVVVTVLPKQNNIQNATIQAKDKEITVGDSFDPLKDVEIIAKDGDTAKTDISSKVTLQSGTVNTAKAGKYTLVYQVTGQNGTTVTAPVTITVVDKPISYEDATIYAENKTVYVGNVFNYKKDVSSVDGDTAKTDITSKLSYAETVDTTKPGTYTVTYKVTGSNGKQITKTITVTVIYQTGALAIDKQLVTSTGSDFNQTEVNPGDILYYKITVTNIVENSTVEDIVVNDTLPAGVSYQENSLTIDGTKVANTDLQAIKLDTLLGNKNHEILFAVQVKDNASGKITNVASVSGKTIDNKQNESSTNVKQLENATINAAAKEITVGDTFDYEKDVTAKDGDLAHTDITSKMTYDRTVDTTKAGIYYVTYKVTGKNGQEVINKIKVTVKDKETPITNASIHASNYSLDLNETFDPMKGVTATDGDKDKTDLTKKVTYDGTVDTTKAGVYTVTYKVKGTNNNEVTMPIKITVVAKDAIITAGNRSIQLGQSFDPLKEVKAEDQDGYQTDLTAKINVKQNNVDVNRAGKYKIIYTVIGSNGKTVEKEIEVTVTAKDATIIVTDKTVYKGDTFDPMQAVTAIDGDGNDTNITDKVTVEKNTVDTSKVGKYQVTYSVIGSNGNKVTEVMDVNVLAKQGDLTIAKQVESKSGEDLNNQIVTAGSEIVYKIKVKNPIANSEVKQVQLTDNIPKGTDVKTDEVTVKGTNVKPVWDGNKYTLSVETLEDSDEIEMTIPVTIQADYTGELTNVANVSGETVTMKNATTSITGKESGKAAILATNKTIEINDSFDPMAGISAVDKDNSDITANIKIQSNNVNTHKIGIYTIIYEVETQDGKLTKEVQVEVTGKNATIIADDQKLKVNDSFNPLDIVSAIDGDGEDTNISKSIKIEENNVDTSISGNYEVLYSVKGINGEVIKKTIQVQVVANDATIEVENYTGIVGENFNALTNVLAVDGDGRDTNLTAKLKVTLNTVDTNHAGHYEVQYEVTGENGNQVTKLIQVTIVAKDASIHAENKAIQIGDKFDPLQDVTAVDGDGYETDLTANVDVIANTVDSSQVGNYTVTYSVTGANGKAVTQTITVVVEESPGDLAISKTVANTNGNKTASPGDTLVYTIKVENPTEKGSVRQVVVKDDLPEGLLLTDESIEINGKAASYEIAGNKMEIALGELGAKEEKVLTFRTKVTTKAATKITNIAQVTGVNSTQSQETSADITAEYPDASIYASDKTIKVGDKFEPLKDVIAQDFDETDLTAAIKIKSNTVNPDKAGEYKIIYAVSGKNEKEITKEVKVTVLSKDAIIVIDDLTTNLTIGENFDPMKGITAYDGNINIAQIAEVSVLPNDLTSKITIETNTVDTKKVGQYQVVYAVTGSNGVEVKKTRKVNVLAKDASIKAKNTSIKLGENFDPLQAVTAIDGDENQTDISDKITVEQNNVNNKKVGDYAVVYVVTGSNGNKVTKKIKVSVINGKEAGVDDTSNTTKDKQKQTKKISIKEVPSKDPVTKVKKLLQTGDAATWIYTAIGILFVIGAWVTRRNSRNNFL